jgi:hypothetical protein
MSAGSKEIITQESRIEELFRSKLFVELVKIFEEEKFLSELCWFGFQYPEIIINRVNEINLAEPGNNITPNDYFDLPDVQEEIEKLIRKSYNNLPLQNNIGQPSYKKYKELVKSHIETGLWDILDSRSDLPQSTTTSHATFESLRGRLLAERRELVF